MVTVDIGEGALYNDGRNTRKELTLMMHTAQVRLMLLLVSILLVLVPVLPGLTQEVLTNDTVVAMKKGGLADAVILAKIRASQAKFDVSTPALIRLKEAGLSDQIIEAMVSHAGPGRPPATGTAPAATPGPSGLPAASRESIFHAIGDKYVELMAAVSSVETNFAVFTAKSELVLKGRKAEYRIADRKPVFFSAFAPNEVPLVKLKPGDSHDDRNLKISKGSFAPFGGTHKFGVRSEDKVDVASEKDPRGFFRITPREPLTPGEYGFILTQGFATGSGKIYDFGVD